MTSGQRLIERLNPQPGERILDAGCGMGELAAQIAAGGAIVTGLDCSAVLLEQARLAHPEVEWIQGDLLTVELRAEFDAVFAHASLHWMRDYPRALAKIHSFLKLGGRLVASVGGVAAALAMMEAELPSPDVLCNLLKAQGFVVVAMDAEPGLLMFEARKLE